MSHQDFAARVRAERKSRRWTQQELADKASVSLRTVQMFETRKAEPQPENLRLILAAVGINPDDEVADATREDWPLDVKVALDMIGAYLVTFSEDQRLDVIHDLTRQIFAARH